MICKKIIFQSCDCQKCYRNDTCIISNDTRSQIVCKENQKNYTLINNTSTLIYNYKLDNGVITDTSVQKCDNLIFIPRKNKIILVELKGTSYPTAVKQISNTISMFKSNFSGKKIFGRIICQGVPNIQNSPQVITLKRELQKSDGNLKSKSIKFEEIETQMTN